jgi:hypothetical protein
LIQRKKATYSNEEGGRKKAEGRRQKEECRMQKAEGRTGPFGSRSDRLLVAPSGLD